MFDPTEYPPEDLTLDQARALRSEQARLAEAHANRVAQLRAWGRLREAAESNQSYRLCARRCRLLGERIREDQMLPPAPAQAA
jgi:transcription elongation GreA/GreB family factor